MHCTDNGITPEDDDTASCIEWLMLMHHKYCSNSIMLSYRSCKYSCTLSKQLHYMYCQKKTLGHTLCTYKTNVISKYTCHLSKVWENYSSLFWWCIAYRLRTHCTQCKILSVNELHSIHGCPENTLCSENINMYNFTLKPCIHMCFIAFCMQMRTKYTDKILLIECLSLIQITLITLTLHVSYLGLCYNKLWQSHS